LVQNILNGGQVIVDYLIREKVPHVFGLCGHGNISFIDALYERSDEIASISVRHESVAGFMADVYYRVAGRPTATFTSCGPGSANLPIALANAFLDSVPFLAITGNLMHASVLAAAVEYELPVVWVVWNNYAYASIRGLQRGYLEGRELVTDFHHPETGVPYNPDFRGDGALGRGDGGQRRPPRRSVRCGQGGHRVGPAVPDRRQHRGGSKSGRRRRMGASRPRPRRARDWRPISTGIAEFDSCATSADQSPPAYRSALTSRRSMVAASIAGQSIPMPRPGASGTPTSPRASGRMTSSTPYSNAG
jgi:Thiamine pyrophosphate enzyme, N-terminal TPP binding domain